VEGCKQINEKQKDNGFAGVPGVLDGAILINGNLKININNIDY